MKFATAAFALALSGCNLISQIGAPIVVGGVAISTPAVEVPGLIDVPASVVASVWVGERVEGTLDEAHAMDGLDVTMSYAGGSLLLEAEGREPGLYYVASSDLAYQPGDTYVFDAIIDGQAYGGEVVAPPQLTEEDVTLTPALMDKAHGKHTALTARWPLSRGRFGLVAVFRANPSDPQNPDLVFDNRPKNANDMIAMLSERGPTELEIPGETFAQDGVYAVVLAVADKGDIRENTSIVSPLLVGSATSIIFSVGSQ